MTWHSCLQATAGQTSRTHSSCVTEALSPSTITSPSPPLPSPWLCTLTLVYESILFFHTNLSVYVGRAGSHYAGSPEVIASRSTLAVERGLQGAWACRAAAACSAAVALGLQSTGLGAVAHGLSCSAAWGSSQTGDGMLSSCMRQAGFFTTEPQGSPV